MQKPNRRVFHAYQPLVHAAKVTARPGTVKRKESFQPNRSGDVSAHASVRKRSDQTEGQSRLVQQTKAPQRDSLNDGVCHFYETAYGTTCTSGQVLHLTQCQIYVFRESNSCSNYIQLMGSVFLLPRGRVSLLQQEVLR